MQPAVAVDHADAAIAILAELTDLGHVNAAVGASHHRFRGFQATHDVGCRGSLARG